MAKQDKSSDNNQNLHIESVTNLRDRIFNDKWPTHWFFSDFTEKSVIFTFFRDIENSGSIHDLEILTYGSIRHQLSWEHGTGEDLLCS